MTTETGQPTATQTLDSAQPIVFFDGTCGLCDRTVQSLLNRDRHGRLKFAPLQGETARHRLGEEAARELKTLILVDGTGESRRSSAVVRILNHLGGGYKILGGLLWLIPRPLRDFGYNFVAARRYRWFGHVDACRLPKPHERERFLP
jgi:predicted DCC family thiol-disulfide oxidoreductase YuxK